MAHVLQGDHPLYHYARKHGLTAKELCARVQCTRQSLHYWNRARFFPSRSALEKIARGTGGEVAPVDCLTYFYANVDKAG